MGRSQHLFRNALSDQFSLLDHQYPIRQSQHFGQIMGDINHGNLKFVTNAAEIGQYFFFQADIESRQRFIQQEQFRLRKNSSGQCDSLRFPS